MIYTILWTLLGIICGYIISEYVNYIYKYLCYRNISNFSKCTIILMTTFASFLKGYTGNDLSTNIYKSVT